MPTKPNTKAPQNIALYPNSHDIPSLSKQALALKIARHSRCSVCEECIGLAPEAVVNVVLESEWEKSSYGPANYISTCRCSHGVGEHALFEDVTPEEFNRRGRVAVRLDELLADIDKLLDFDYQDEDIVSVRKQMRLPEEALSPLSEDLFSPEPPASRKHTRSSSPFASPQPLPKRRRLSTGRDPALTDYSSSPLSNADDMEQDEEDEEDEDEDEEAVKKDDLDAARSQKQTQHSDLDADDSDSDEEDQPLALMNGSKPQVQSGRVPVPARHSGKKTAGHITVAGTAPAPQTFHPSKKSTESAGSGKSKGKIEELGEEQLQRLATGVTVDTVGENVQPHNRPLKPSQLESQAGLLKIISLPPSYPNRPSPRTLVLLTNLKCLFQKQLPKMPREYITRLVFDKNSHCMAIVKRGLKVVGGICYRVFEQRGFAEIVFFATASVDQVRGYGSMLMNHFKMHIKNTYPGMMYFLTYADNYAVGYFKKQGFSKEITLERAVWAGYIKDYEGGTIMQCTMLRRVNYLETRDILAKQREVILAKIREISKSHVVYDPLPQFLHAKKGEEVTVDWQDVPGLRESGWTPSMIETPRPASKNPQHVTMARWLSELQGHSAAWPFLQPVNGEEVTDYYDVIKNPMDFSTMEHKLDHNVYMDIDSFVADAILVFDNCILYNPEGSIYAKSALKLAKFLKELVAEDMKNMRINGQL